MIECPHCGFEEASEFFPKNPVFVSEKKNRTQIREGYAWQCPRCKELF